MELEDLKNKSYLDLLGLLAQEQAQLHALYLKAYSRSLKQVHKIKQVRCTIAQIMTLLNLKKPKN